MGIRVQHSTCETQGRHTIQPRVSPEQAGTGGSEQTQICRSNPDSTGDLPTSLSVSLSVRIRRRATFTCLDSYRVNEMASAQGFCLALANRAALVGRTSVGWSNGSVLRLGVARGLPGFRLW